MKAVAGFLIVLLLSPHIACASEAEAKKRDTFSRVRELDASIAVLLDHDFHEGRTPGRLPPKEEMIHALTQEMATLRPYEWNSLLQSLTESYVHHPDHRATLESLLKTLSPQVDKLKIKEKKDLYWRVGRDVLIITAVILALKAGKKPAQFVGGKVKTGFQSLMAGVARSSKDVKAVQKLVQVYQYRVLGKVSLQGTAQLLSHIPVAVARIAWKAPGAALSQAIQQPWWLGVGASTLAVEGLRAVMHEERIRADEGLTAMRTGALALLQARLDDLIIQKKRLSVASLDATSVTSSVESDPLGLRFETISTREDLAREVASSELELQSLNGLEHLSDEHGAALKGLQEKISKLAP